MKKQKKKQKRLKRTLIGIAIVWFITAFATAVWAQGQITEFEFKARQALNGELGLNYTAERLKSQNLSIKEHVWKLLTEEGGLTFDEAIEAMAVIELESHWDVYAIGDNGLSHGLWQIHEPSHPNISRACKFDVYCSTREAIKIYKEWGGWYAWSTYKLIK